MSNKPPQFEDEDLPSWLQEGGIIPERDARDARKTPNADTSAQPDFDWFASTTDDVDDDGVDTLRFDDNYEPRRPNPANAVVDAADALPWMRGQEQADQGVSSMQLLGWETDQLAGSPPNDELTPLPWMADPGVPAQPTAARQPAQDDLLADLFADLNPPEQPQPTPPSAKPSTSSLLGGQHDAPTQGPRRTLPKSGKLGPSSASPAPAPNLDDWLSNMNLGTSAAAGTPGEGDMPGESDMPAPEDYMPDWLLAGQMPTSDVPSAPSQPSMDMDALANLFEDKPSGKPAAPLTTTATGTFAPTALESDVPAWLQNMDTGSGAPSGPQLHMPSAPPTPPAPKAKTPAAPATPPPDSYGWLDNLDVQPSSASGISDSAAQQAAELAWTPEASPGSGASGAAPAPDATPDLSVDDLLKSSVTNIDNLLSLSNLKRPTSETPVPTFDSGTFDAPPAVSSKMTGPLRPKEAPKDDLDSLFANDVLGDAVFDRSDPAIRDLQGVELQGTTSMLDMGGADFGNVPLVPPADAQESPSVGTTKLLSRKDRSFTPPVSPVPVTPPPDALRGFDQPAEVLPEWVADLRPSDAPVVLNVGDQVVKLTEEPIAKLPEQVRNLRERAKEFRVQETKQTAPLEGPLAGIAGAITPIAPQAITGTPSASIAKRAAASSDTFSERVKALQTLLNLENEVLERRKLEEAQREAEEAGEAGIAIKPAPRARLSVKVDRLILTLFLLVMVLLPFFFGSATFMPALDAVSQRASAADPRYERVSSAVRQVQAGALVLVVFEYAPTAAAEMDEMARALLVHLIQGGARPILISTNPAGASHAYDLMDRLGRDQTLRSVLKRTGDLVNRQDYFVLRYLSGGIVGLRTLVNALYSPGIDPIFVTDIEGRLTELGAEQVQSLRALPTFVLAETADDVRSWAEQFRAPALAASAGAPSQPNEELRMVMLTSAGASAIAESYAAGRGTSIVGMLVGMRDAAIYRRIHGLEGSAEAARVADQRWQSLQLGLLLAAFVLLFGMIMNTLRSLLRRRGAR